MVYKPSKPGVTLAELLATRAVEPYTHEPNKHSLPHFHSNFFVRILASRPKQDLLTQRIYPSFLLTKLGVQDASTIGPLPLGSTNRGKRVHISSFPNNARFSKRIRGFFAQKDGQYGRFAYHCDAAAVEAWLLTEIRRLLAQYEAGEEPVVCVFSDSTTREHAPHVYCMDLSGTKLESLGIPGKIHASMTGLHLAGFIYKYLYLQGKIRDLEGVPEGVHDSG